jgi:hypothetical protein
VNHQIPLTIDIELRKGESPDDRFVRWIEANPKVLHLFIHLALEAKSRGWERIGSTLIVQRMRWEWKGFKIGNQYTPRLARLAVLCEPSLENLFKFKPLGSTVKVTIKEIEDAGSIKKTKRKVIYGSSAKRKKRHKDSTPAKRVSLANKAGTTRRQINGRDGGRTSRKAILSKGRRVTQ